VVAYLIVRKLEQSRKHPRMAVCMTRLSISRGVFFDIDDRTTVTTLWVLDPNDVP
jgi:hypothetical protein